MIEIENTPLIMCPRPVSAPPQRAYVAQLERIAAAAIPPPMPPQRVASDEDGAAPPAKKPRNRK